MYTLHYISTIQMLYYGNDEEFPRKVINTGKTANQSLCNRVSKVLRCGKNPTLFNSSALNRDGTKRSWKRLLKFR